MPQLPIDHAIIQLSTRSCKNTEMGWTDYTYILLGAHSTCVFLIWCLGDKFHWFCGSKSAHMSLIFWVENYLSK